MKKKTSKKLFKCNHAETETSEPGEICDDCFDVVMTDINECVWEATKKLLDKYENVNASAQIIMNSLLREGSFVGSLMELTVGDFAKESVETYQDVLTFLNEDDDEVSEQAPKAQEKLPEEKSTPEATPTKQTTDKTLN